MMRVHYFFNRGLIDWTFRSSITFLRRSVAKGPWRRIALLQITFHPGISLLIMTLSLHSLSLNGCTFHLWNTCGLSMSRFCHAQHSSPRHWPSTATVNDNGTAGKCSSLNIREETQRGIRLDWVSAFLRKKAYSLANVLSNDKIIS